MPFEVGHKKVGGRQKKGTKNKQMAQVTAMRAEVISQAFAVRSWVGPWRP
jgi:hypothetical protein